MDRPSGRINPPGKEVAEGIDFENKVTAETALEDEINTDYGRGEAVSRELRRPVALMEPLRQHCEPTTKRLKGDRPT
jgi:hypothetical protein